ncbi:SDR family NAD(P)-dependent oxidoreductase [Novosphingobium sp.]|uniref:SDR family NAD(P)-dependent oxidoreductase n=1 Tax=Novosphingobium sp. TaxID=1874826 RepID=UPI003BAB97C6
MTAEHHTAGQRVALVTGASSGIGKVAAKQLAAAGYIVFPAARRIEAMADLIPLGCRPIRLDLNDPAAVEAVVAEIVGQVGGIDLLVSNAADGALGPLEEVEIAGMRAQFETNVFAPTRLIQLVIPAMRQRGGGRVALVSSMGGEHTTPCSGSYHATKYATEALADSWRFELASSGIDIAVIQPAVVDTPMARNSSVNLKARTGRYAPLLHKMGEMAETAIVKRQGVVTPEAVAKAIVHAATARRPKTRYKVGMAAHLLPAMRRWLPDRAYDAVWRKAFNVTF